MTHIFLGKEEAKSPSKVRARPLHRRLWESDKGLESFPEGMRMGELTKNEVTDGSFEDLGIYIQQILRENSLTKELL